MSVSPEPTGPGVFAQPSRPNALAGNALGVASMLAWAAGFPAAEILLDTWPPLTLVSARFAIAVAILVPVWALIDGPRAVLRADWGHGTLVGGFCFGLGAFLLLLAQDYTGPVTVALIASMCPVVAAVIEMMAGARRITKRFALGVAVSVVGGIIAAQAVSFPDTFGLGALCGLASCILFSVGSYLTVRDFPDLSPTGRSTITLAGGFVMAAALLILAEMAGMDMMSGATLANGALGPLMIYAVAGMALSQVMFIACVGRLGVAVASIHINAAPFYVMLILLALGGTWNWQQVIGAAIVAVGVFLAQRD